MTREEFKEIVTTFVASEDDVIESCGNFLITIDDVEINVKLKKGNEDQLFCIEDNWKMPATQWIVQRLAKLDILAKALLDHIPNDDHFISIPATMSTIFTDQAKECDDVVCTLQNQLDERNEFVTQVIYLTSEAGEGKTCVMNELARRQARAYLNKKAKWLFVPIALSGRPFMRLDEIIIGTLANTYRFRSYYIETFLMLMRKGLIVLGLDGFEEMAIEGTEGDVVSSMGNLLKGLKSEGRMVFSTRKAYYAYTNMNTQASLFNSLRNQEVEFSEINLNKWSGCQFRELMVSYGFSKEEAECNYKELADALTESHPILRRAVLARKLVEELYNEAGNNLREVIKQFVIGDKDEIIFKFVHMMILRESNKWIARDEMSKPLLSVEQHEALLEEIAEEMWRTSTEYVKYDALISITEIICGEFELTPTLISQCKERIIHHALLSPSNGKFFSFCHEEFFYYYLGRFIAANLKCPINETQVRRILDKKILPQLSVQECCRTIKKHTDVAVVRDVIINLSKRTTRSSCLSQNLGMILFMLLRDHSESFVVSEVYCSKQALSGIPIQNVVLDTCFIECFKMKSSRVRNVEFKNCDCVELIVYRGENYSLIKFDKNSLPKVLIIKSDNEETPIYEPAKIMRMMVSFGFNISETTLESYNEQEDEEDEIVSLFFKIVMSFKRSTGINENVLRTKTGIKWANFEKNVLGPMLDINVFVEIPYRGSDKQRRFRLNAPFDVLSEARKVCNGCGDKLIEYLRKQNLQAR